MNFLSGLFGGTKKSMTIRYSKSGDTWQVYNEGRIVYWGSKSSCNKYMQFMAGVPA